MNAIETTGIQPAPAAIGRLHLAVVIPTYGREQVLVDTIRQLLLQQPAADEILVVDQTPAHEAATSEFLKQQVGLGSIRWIRQSPPNLPAARNRGLRETKCEVVLFLDDDIVPAPGLIGYHLQNYESSLVDAVAGRTLGPTAAEPRLEPAGIAPPLQYRRFDFAAAVRREGIAALLGANHSVRREAVLALGGYDENYIGWAFREETDLALRLYAASRKIVFDPRAEVQHLPAPSGGCRISGFHQALREWKISFPAHYFAWKHLFAGRWFWREVAESFARSVLCRKNARAPYRIPGAILSFLFSLAYSGWRWHRCR